MDANAVISENTWIRKIREKWAGAKRAKNRTKGQKTAQKGKKPAQKGPFPVSIHFFCLFFLRSPAESRHFTPLFVT